MVIENVLIIAVQSKTADDVEINYSVEELVSLTNTAKGEVKQTIIQKREHPHPALYVGKGKLEEIQEIIESDEIDLVIANDELTATQMRNLQQHLDVRVIDRSQLILDIFAQRAHTKEGKLQVELAQYQYMLPRLHGQGQQLSRLGGGIGTRGPGETKLESDRRHINRRINEVKRQLEAVVNQRDQYRKRRKRNRVTQIAIVGYTNAGKSTLFNRLTQSDSLEEDQLFATLDPMSRQVKFPSGLQAIITDTVGFMQDLPTALIAAFRSTLEEVKEADFIFHVVDSTHPDKEQHQQTVLRLLSELDADHLPILTIYNKNDLLSEDLIPFSQPSIMISAFNQSDRLRLLKETEKTLIERWEFFYKVIQASNGKLLQLFRQQTIIQDQTFDSENEVYIVQGYAPNGHPLLYD
ncbi:GTPase HflX [Paraliobacillus sp. PM-2]|uniref:GTPase HflX n=1 Tax=Paraliobacillus sp. PM-2 TaxID=1462524 RepID=UPI00061BB0C2|nr:GTPase HflX [Paraliobacillus sp. PM-2]CQR47611.1 GTPase HflX [Paraliobacillus sp. PM-2]